MFISFVIAIYNEQDTISELYKRLKSVIVEQGYKCEIIFINDGSRDNSLNILKDLLKRGEENVIVIEMSNNFGQIAAFSAGFTQAKGDVVVTLDADLQNYPEDVPLLIEKINDGYSLVGGIRKARRDTFRRKIVGNIANYLNFILTKVRVQDIGCSIKAYRRHVVEGLRSPAGIVKFNAVAAFSLTKDVIEIPVRHANRAYGKSKWNFLSMFQHNLDIWISSNNVIPRLIVAIGAAGFFYGFVMYLLFFIGVVKVSNAMSAGGAILLNAFIILLLGIIAEVCIKILKEFRGTLSYNIKKIWTKDNVC
jgi:undecaprenyl-phosphate 4-deoxy-4-formamido-L-arabinose transferase